VDSNNGLYVISGIGTSIKSYLSPSKVV